MWHFKCIKERRGESFHLFFNKNGVGGRFSSKKSTSGLIFFVKLTLDEDSKL